MFFSSQYVIFLFRDDYFWTKLVLVKGPQFGIYQKRNQKIEQTPGPDEVASNKIKVKDTKTQKIK